MDNYANETTRSAHHFELIDLARLTKVMRSFGAHKMNAHSNAGAAYRQLVRMCKYEVGQQVQFRVGKDGEWQDGVVVAYMMSPPQFVCGPGDSRDDRPKDEQMWGLCERFVRPRPAPPPEGEASPPAPGEEPR